MRRRVIFAILAVLLVIAACITIPCVILISPVSSQSGGSGSGAGGDDGHGGKGGSSENDGRSSNADSEFSSSDRSLDEMNRSRSSLSGPSVGLDRTGSEQEGRRASRSGASSFTSSDQDFPRGHMSSVVESSFQQAASEIAPTVAAASSSVLTQAANSAAAVAQASVEPAQRVSGNAPAFLRAAVSAVGSTHSVSSSRNQRWTAASAVVEPQLKAVAQSVAASVAHSRASASDSSIIPSSQNGRSGPSITEIARSDVSAERASALDGIAEIDSLMTRVGEHIDTSGGVDIDGVISTFSATGLVPKEQLGNVRVMIAEGLQAAQNGSQPSAEVERAGNELLQSFGERMLTSGDRPAGRSLKNAASAVAAFPRASHNDMMRTFTAETAHLLPMGSATQSSVERAFSTKVSASMRESTNGAPPGSTGRFSQRNPFV